MSNSRPLTIGYNGTVESFTMSPLRVKTRGGVTRWVYSSLFRFDESANLEGDLVDSWSVSLDELVYDITLKKGVLWHDGTPLTSHDVVFTANKLLEPDRAFRNTLLVGGQPVRFEAIDDHRLLITLSRPQTNFLAYLTPVWGSLFLIIPRHVIEAEGEDAFERNPIGTGPFKFGGVENGNLVLTANRNYFDGKPRSDQILVRFYPDNAERLKALEDGDLDILILPGRDYTAADAARAQSTLHTTATNTIVQFAMNCRHPFFGTKTRQAIAAAVDRVSMVAEIEGEGVLPAYSPVGVPSWAYTDELETHPFNPVRARQLLLEDGWSPGPDGVLARDGVRFEFSILYPPEQWNYRLGDHAQAISSYLKDVGIVATPVASDYWGTLKTAWRSHQFEAFIYYDTFYIEPDLYWSWHSSMPKRPDTPEAPSALPQYGYGVTGYANPEVDRLIEEYRTASDRTRQRQLLVAAQKIMADEVASLWLYNHNWKNVVRRGVVGLSPAGISDGTSDLVVLLRPERLARSSESVFDD